MNPNSKEFKKLKNKWYKKLEESGFDDIEYTGESDGVLQTFDSYKARKMLKDWSAVTLEGTEEYFRLARQFLHSHQFEDVREKLIWEAHSEGVGIREIIKIVKGRGYSAYRDLIQRVLKKLAIEMRTANNL